MELIKRYNFTPEYLNSTSESTPIILCIESAKIAETIYNSGFKTVSLNVMLAKALLEFDPEARPEAINLVLSKILAFHIPIFLIDFEMLFDPRYNIDPLKYFCDKARVTQLIVKWPGHFRDGKLIYAEPDDPEYKEYNCNDYQIRIVQ